MRWTRAAALVAVMAVCASAGEDGANPAGAAPRLPAPRCAVMRVGRLRTAHDGSVLAVSFADRGATIVSAGADATIRWTDAKSGAPKASLGVADAFDIAALESESRWLTWARGPRLYVDEIGSAPRPWRGRGAGTQFEGDELSVHSLTFSNDGSVAYACQKNGLATSGLSRSGDVRWSWEFEKVLHVLVTGKDAATAAIVHGGKLFADVDRRNWMSLTAHDASVNAVAFSKDGSLFAAGADDGSASVWRWRSTTSADKKSRTPGELLLRTSTPGHAAVHDLGCSGDRVAMWVDDRKTVRIVNLATRRDTLLCECPEEIAATAVSDDHRLLVCGTKPGRLFAWDLKWDLSEATGPRRVGDDSPAALRADVLTDGRVAVRFGDGAVRTWTADGSPSADILPTTAGDRIAAISPDGASVAVVDASGALRFERTADRSVTWRATAPTKSIVRISRDGAVLLYFDAQSALHLLKCSDGSPATLPPDAAWLWREAPELIAAGPGLALDVPDALGRAVRVAPAWVAESGAVSVAVDPSGRFGAGAIFEGGVVLHDPATAAAPVQLVDGDEPWNSGRARHSLVVAFSADGSRLAGSFACGLVLVWDTRTRKVVARLDGHDAAPDWLLWSGKRLVSCSRDGTAIVWSVP